MTDVTSSRASSLKSVVAKDSFSFWPVVFFYFIIFGPLLASRFWAQNDFIGLLLLVVSIVGALILAVIHVLKGHWKKSLSVVFAPLIAGAIVFTHSYLGFDVQWTKFQMARPYYIWSVKGSDYAAFEWPEHGIFLGGGWNETLIYDPSGQTMTNLKSFPSLAKYVGDHVDVRIMGGHFYLVTSTYGMD